MGSGDLIHVSYMLKTLEMQNKMRILSLSKGAILTRCVGNN